MTYATITMRKRQNPQSVGPRGFVGRLLDGGEHLVLQDEERPDNSRCNSKDARDEFIRGVLNRGVTGQAEDARSKDACPQDESEDADEDDFRLGPHDNS